jgi:hypothetical protein
LRRRLRCGTFAIVEHLCESCGQTVEDGTAFCPKCNAPQIRIVREVPPGVPAGPSFDPGTPGELQPAAIPVPLGYPQTDWRSGRRAAIAWGLLASVVCLFAMPSPPAFFVAAVFGFGFAGALAVGSYARRSHVPLTAGIGARIGAITGLVGLVVIEIVAAAAALAAGYLMRGNPELRSALEKQLQPAEPQVREMMLRLLDRPGELAVLLLVVAFFYGLLFVLSAAAGGALRARRPSR